MQKLKHLFLALICFLFYLPSQAQSPLAEGQVLKIEIPQTGVYKITGDDLANAGLNLSSLSTENIRFFGNAGGMLPQENILSNKYLEELPVEIVAQNNSQFNSADYLLFYAEGADREYFDEQLQLWRVEKNVYAENNFCFLVIGNGNGKRVEELTFSTPSTEMVTTYTEVYHHERELENILNSGRRWFGELFNFENEQSFTIPAEGIINEGNITVYSEAISQSTQSTSFQYSLNGQQLGTLNFNAIPQTTYGRKGDIKTGNFSFTANGVENNLNLSIEYVQNGTGANAYLDFFTLNFERTLSKHEAQQTFWFAPSETIAEFQVAEVNNSDRIWHIEDFSQVHSIPKATNTTFEGKKTGKYIVFNSESAFSPQRLERVENQDVAGVNPTELLIISPKAFLPEAERLATFRSEFNGIGSQVVAVEEIYNEYSSGKQDITAIRNFIRQLYLKEENTLKYILLFGDGSYDYKAIEQEAITSHIPVYESYESLHPIYSFSSDDYFGFMEENEGTWRESFSDNSHTMELAVGRLPINSLEQAKDIVDKLIRYNSSTEALGNWRNQIAFVADDGDFNIHQTQADQLGEFVEENLKDLNVSRLFVDAFPQETTPFGKKSFALKERINQMIDKGTFIVNYSGHGAETGWTSEGILDNPQILDWENTNRLPLMITATCEFGRHDDPNKTSGAEYAVLSAQGGAIGLLTTTRPVFSNTNFEVNKAFYNALANAENAEQLTLGTLMRATKNNSISGVINRNFTLLGDPSMPLALPKQEAKLTTINGNNVTNGANIPLQALAEVTMEGVILNGDNGVDENFDGTLTVTVFDKSVALETLGDDGPNTILAYQSQERKIFQGEVSVNKGKYTLRFVVPKNINYAEGFGKVSLYAKSKTELTDAVGYYDVIALEGSSTLTPDDTAPTIAAYLEDRTFESGGLVSPNTTLLVDLEDEQGINVLGNGINQDIIAILDGNRSFNLSEFYTSALDDFRKGTITFPLRDLATGPHTLDIQAWDTHNNVAKAELNFIVSNSEAFTLSEVNAYPNPSQGQPVTLGFSHNKTGQAMEVELSIFSLSGKQIFNQTASYERSPSFVSFSMWNTPTVQQESLTPGIYIFQFVSILSETGEVITRKGKLMINR